MPFDPNFPPPGAGLVSADWRAQFNSLKALCDTQAAQIAALQAQVASLQTQINARATTTDLNTAIAGTANSTNSVSDLPGFVASDPPLQSDVQAIADKVNELINTSHR